MQRPRHSFGWRCLSALWQVDHFFCMLYDMRLSGSAKPDGMLCYLLAHRYRTVCICSNCRVGPVRPHDSPGAILLVACVPLPLLPLPPQPLDPVSPVCPHCSCSWYCTGAGLSRTMGCSHPYSCLVHGRWAKTICCQRWAVIGLIFLRTLCCHSGSHRPPVSFPLLLLLECGMRFIDMCCWLQGHAALACVASFTGSASGGLAYALCTY